MDAGAAIEVTDLPSMGAKLVLLFILLLPLVLGVYLMFFSRHATRLLSVFDFAPPGKYPVWDRLNHMFYTVAGFVLLFVGLKLFPYAWQAIKSWSEASP